MCMHTYVPNVATESRNSTPAVLKLRVTSENSASYTLSLFLRSQSPPSSQRRFTLSRLRFKDCHSPKAMSALQQACRLGQRWVVVTVHSDLPPIRVAGNQ